MSQMIRRAAFALALTVPALAGMPAAAQYDDVSSLSEKVAQMQRDMAVLQQQVFSGRTAAPGAAPAGGNVATADTLNRMTQLQAEMSRITGQLEETNYAVAQLKQRLDRMQSDTDFRLSELEKGGGGAAAAGAAAVAAAPAAGAPATGAPVVAGPATPTLAGQAPNAAGATGLAPGPQPFGRTPPSPPIATAPPVPAGSAAQPTGRPPAVQLPPGNARQQYDYAFELLTKNDYPRAEQAFKQFLAGHPTDELAGNAQYWLGETYYVRQQYNDAAAQFLEGYQKYPKSPKAPDNLLKLGLALANTGKTKEACVAFGRFDKDYPTASGTLKRRVVEERQRLSCA